MVRRELLGVVIQLLADSGATVLFSSHQFADVERLAQRIGILHHGRLICDTTLADLQENCARVVVGGENGVESRLRGDDRCVHVAPHRDGWLVTVRRPPAEAADFAREIGGTLMDAQGLSLEELFVEWTEGGW